MRKCEGSNCRTINHDFLFSIFFMSTRAHESRAHEQRAHDSRAHDSRAHEHMIHEHTNNESRTCGKHTIHEHLVLRRGRHELLFSDAKLAKYILQQIIRTNRPCNFAEVVQGLFNVHGEEVRGHGVFDAIENAF
jgi:hypothetical protein